MSRQAARSPSPQPMSKRDKRRQQLAEKLSHMADSFAANHFDHYYAQLSAIQCDINLVLRADPYRSAPLPDSSEDISQAIAEARQEVTRRAPIGEEAEASFNALSGRHYSKFVSKVNRALEERDTELAMLFNQHQDNLDELRRTNQYKTELAHQEHSLLARTLRDRLIQSVQTKKAKLQKDKEQLDIGDSSALLLNPSQYSLGNASSPNGKTNRQTRHTRGRQGESAAATAAAEETTPTPVPAEPTNGNKRKRKHADEDGGSPVPPARIGEAAGIMAFPQHEARSRLYSSQFEAPLYSIDRLFSEKELALNMNKAHIATNEHFAKLRFENRLHQAAAAQQANGTNGTDTDTEAGARNDLSNAVPTAEATDAASSAPGSPGVQEATPAIPAQPLHATRAAQRANPLNELAGSSSLLPASMNPGIMPAVYNVTIPSLSSSSKATPSAPSPAGLTDVEVQNDLTLMSKDMDDPVMKILGEKCLEKRGVVDLPAATTAGVLGQGPTSAAAGGFTPIGDSGGMAMSRGPSAIGGASMSRVLSTIGGEPMSRSVSAADFGRRGAR